MSMKKLKIKSIRSYRRRNRSKTLVQVKKPEGIVMHTTKQHKNTISLKKYLKLNKNQFQDV